MGDAVVFNENVADMRHRENTAEDCSQSSSEAGQTQGSMGAVISQSSRTTFFFLSANVFASFTAVMLFLRCRERPQTARIPPLSPLLQVRPPHRAERCCFS